MRGARISVLTTEPYAGWLRTFPYFDEVLVDPRPPWWDLPSLYRLAANAGRRTFQPGVRLADISEVLPLLPSFSGKTSARMVRHRVWLFAAGPRATAATSCTTPSGSRGSCARPGSACFRRPICPGAGAISRGSTSRPIFALLVPGSSPDRLGKRWPAARYQALARTARRTGDHAGGDRQRAREGSGGGNPRGDRPDRTNQLFGDLCDLARAARFAVGNDTGPMHLIAAAGCPAITLFSNDSNPAQCAPRGRWTRVLQRPDLADLPVEAVTCESLPD